MGLLHVLVESRKTLLVEWKKRTDAKTNIVLSVQIMLTEWVSKWIN